MEFEYLDLRGTEHFRTVVEFDLETEAELLETFKRAARSFKNTVVLADKNHPMFKDNKVVLLGEIGIERVELAIKYQQRLELIQRRSMNLNKAKEITVNPKYL